MSLYEAGIKENEFGAVALMGTAFTQQYKNMILNTRCVQNIILWFDNDDAGKASTINNGLQLLSLHKNMFVVNNQTKYKDVNEILVKEGKQKVLDILQNPQNPRFVSYYITQTLSNLTNLNIDNKVRDVLKVIKVENNPAHFESYLELIFSITKLSVNDLKKTYESVAGYTSTFNNKKVKVTYQPAVNNLIKMFGQLVTTLLIDPSLAEDAYDNLEYKAIDKINVEEIQDFIYIIKMLATTAFAPTDLLGQQNKIVQDLFKNKKINKAVCASVLSILDELAASSSYSIVRTATKTKCKAMVEHINYGFDEILLAQYKYDLANKKVSEQELNDIKLEIQKLNTKINNFKRHKKTKYHSA
ncbi:MAG: toprim domain-containing protein [Mycoplasmoidaceae bacterium]|nr:toprim domain-containing protein [Mycoplasmoidaceae bacterium]